MKFWVILLILLVVSNSSVGAAEIKAHQVCIQASLAAAHLRASKSMVALPKASVSKAVLPLQTTRSFKVLANVFSGAGYVSKTFVLKSQGLSNTAFGQVLVNIWAGADEFSNSGINNLNSLDFFVSQSAREQNRQETLDEIGSTVRTLVLPGSVSAFGQLQEVPNASSDGINILVYDIQDGFPNNGGSYVGGYFDPSDRSGAGGNDNLLNILHMDIYPLNPGGRNNQFGLRKQDFHHVMAHEFQHILHNQFDTAEPVWVNEGFSQFAIYRLLHQQQFADASKILNSPLDQPSQVPFWMQNPSSSLLMTKDEPQLQDIQGARTDSAELRGLGYLFFNYLWQRLGGEIAQNTAAADQLIRQIVQSPLKGVQAIDPVAAQVGLSFSQIFRDFVVALAVDRDSGESRYRLDSFTENGTTALKVSASSASTSLTWRSWEFRFFFLDANTAGILSANTPFQVAVISGGQVIQDGFATAHQISALPNSAVLAISNPSWSTLTFSAPPGSNSAFNATISQLVTGNSQAVSGGGTSDASGGSTSGSSGGGGCFIATATFRDRNHFVVRSLVSFRDEVLLQSDPGRSFVSFYYAVSPTVADWIQESVLLGILLAVLLWPLGIMAHLGSTLLIMVFSFLVLAQFLSKFSRICTKN